MHSLFSGGQEITGGMRLSLLLPSSNVFEPLCVLVKKMSLKLFVLVFFQSKFTTGIHLAPFIYFLNLKHLQEI